MSDETISAKAVTEEDDFIAEMIREEIIKAAMGEVDKPASASRGRKTEVPEAGPDPEADEVIDLGPYCVECREDSTGQEGRTPATMPSAKVTQGSQEYEGAHDDCEIDTAHEHPNDKVTSVLLKGWKCENCQPFEAALIEEALQALVERRYPANEVRQKMRELGDEAIWAKWIGPMLDELETTLGLEIE